MKLYTGVDVGSTSTKVVVWDRGELSRSMMPTIRFLRAYSSGEIALGGVVVATGYGRKRVNADEVIPEVRAHVLGALESTELEDFVLLDIGGQDFKIISVRGQVIEDFVMNDKCAAGTGRFLEKMAAQLDMGLDEMGRYWRDPVEVSSICTVFAETELITRMMDGASPEEMAAGVNWSLYNRLRPYLERYRERPILLSGGGTSMPAFRRILESEGYRVERPEMAEYNGALGCMVMAKKIGKEREKI